MPIVHLPDNSLEIIADNHDLVKLIKQYMGYDTSELVRELVEKDAFLQLEHLLRRVDEELQKDKINRKNIQLLVDRMELEIVNAQ